jgi:predicted PurR-regulated permease PerM
VEDIALIAALEWVYDKLEERFCRMIAWIATFLLSVASLAAIVALALYFLR